MKIAITGGIGSGKSFVCKILKEKGYPVFSCDEIYRELINDKEYLERLEGAFPSTFEKGKLDKRKLSSIVFSAPDELKKLNEIAHPMIMRRLLTEMERSECSVTFAEVPLLFEGNFSDLFDRVLVIMRPMGDRISSVVARDGLSVEEVESRIRNQYDYEKNEELLKTRYDLILNRGSEDSLFLQIDEFLNSLDS